MEFLFRKISFLWSSKTSLVLLILLAFSMAIATFLENDYGTVYARAMVYESWWFELMIFWTCLVFVYHIFKYQLYLFNKIPLLLFHLAFIVICLGAGITRYISIDGTMHIRQGESAAEFLSAQKFVQIKDLQTNQLIFEEPFTVVPQHFSDKSFEVLQQKLQMVDFLSNPKTKIISGNNTVFDVTFSVNGERFDHFFNANDQCFSSLFSFSFGKNNQTDLQIFFENNQWNIVSKVNLQRLNMQNQDSSILPANVASVLKLNTLYQSDFGVFMVKSISKKASVEAKSGSVSEKNKIAQGVLHLKWGKENIYYPLWNTTQIWKEINVSGKRYALSFGPKKYTLPFAINLEKFELKRYPGSNSPESYTSLVNVLDKSQKIPASIYMNHVLDYRGYRFFQASYDNDELGTVLTVSKDAIGTYTTYFGYALLIIGMFLALFAKGSRFQMLLKRLGTQTMFLLLFCAIGFGQNQSKNLFVPEEKAALYGKLIVQDIDGRMKPLNTLSNEISRKLFGKTKVSFLVENQEISLNPDQFLLAIQMHPNLITRLPLIKFDLKNSKHLEVLINKKGKKHISYLDFLDASGNYLLQTEINRITKIKPPFRTESDKESMKLDERFNIFNALLNGDFLKLFPLKGNKNNAWFTAQQWDQAGFEQQDAVFVKNISYIYLEALRTDIGLKNFEKSDKILGYIDFYQKQVGANVYPSETEIDVELLYNKLQLGIILFAWFWIVGVMMLVVVIAKLFSDRKWLNYLNIFCLLMAIIGEILFTFHLLMRWYIAKHPPWSDGFEILVFVAWCTILFGLLFYKKSRFALPLSMIFSGTLLFVAFLDWLNPEITTLMPVLHSYWLKIHVAIIVASYAPLGLSCIMALCFLVLLIFRPKTPNQKWQKSLIELQIVNELSATIGLYLLSVGTFLGGIWANESWGRYWAWDPKETWALISILVYAFLLHLRMIPVFRNAYLFNLVSLWAFASIIMTSFGVNYYLAGLHSYAKGDPVPIPSWVFWGMLMMILISVLAYFKYQKLSAAEKRKLAV